MKTFRSMITILAACLALNVTVTSCHSSRKAAAATTQTAIRNQPADTWTNVYMPVSLSLDKPIDMSFSGRATLAHNQYIHLSLQFIGMEVAFIHANNDSVFFVDKYHKYYLAEPLSTVLGQNYNHLTLGDIQRIILGQTDFKSTDLVSIVATDFCPTPAGDVAQKINIDATTPHGTIDGTIGWTLKNAKWDDPNRKVSLKIPSGYKRILPSGLKNMLKSMAQ